MSNKLEGLLEDVARGKMALAADFYQEFLRSTLFVPETHCPQADKGSVVIGKTPEASLPWIIVRASGFRYLPVFSSEDFGAGWAAPKLLNFSKVGLKNIIWSIGPDVHIFLNPGQEFGKEFTPWEIDLLRQGEEAIAELVSEISPLPDPGIEVTTDRTHLGTLERRLRGVLDVFPEISEGFLIEIADQERQQLLLGLAQSGTSDNLEKRIEEEVRRLSEDQSATGGLPLSIICNLWSSASPHRQLFESAKPFYIRQTGLQEPTFVARFSKTIKSFFSAGQAGEARRS